MIGDIPNSQIPIAGCVGNRDELVSVLPLVLVLQPHGMSDLVDDPSHAAAMDWHEIDELLASALAKLCTAFGNWTKPDVVGFRRSLYQG